MAQLFNNKYRISSACLKNWNYANEAMYFVTICTKNRENYFGEIFNPGDHTIPKIKPTIIGEIAHSEWYKSIELRPDMNLELGEFVVMPNHIHGIIIIGANEINKPKGVDTIMENDRDAIGGNDRDAIGGNDRDAIGGDDRDAMHCVSIIPTTNNINTDDNKYKNHFAPQSKNLSSIIRGYKSAVTTFAKKNNIEFEWQSRFHDHIIQSMDDYHRISKYILNNPSKWLNDKFYQ
ncbi:MAG: hypothetical protein WBB17_13875 [Saprospiraceae bacterium]